MNTQSAFNCIIHTSYGYGYSRFRVCSPDCTLHTAFTGVITELERWSLTWITYALWSNLQYAHTYSLLRALVPIAHYTLESVTWSQQGKRAESHMTSNRVLMCEPLLFQCCNHTSDRTVQNLKRLYIYVYSSYVCTYIYMYSVDQLEAAKKEGMRCDRQIRCTTYQPWIPLLEEVSMNMIKNQWIKLT